jgi:hypothetical protein
MDKKMDKMRKNIEDTHDAFVKDVEEYKVVTKEELKDHHQRIRMNDI